MSDVVVAATGVANLASVKAALERAGARPRVSADAAELERAELVVLPGVGAFGAAMGALRAAGLADALARRATQGRPLLAICLGMQLLAEGSEESPGVRGLGVFPGTVGRFSGPVRIPQLGWNQVRREDGSRLLSPGWAYFANSYRLAALPRGWTGATADHGGQFVAAVERGAVLGCQFHPELSGAWGLELIARWIHASGQLAAGGWQHVTGVTRTDGGQRAVGSGQRVTRATQTSVSTNVTGATPVTPSVRIIPCLDCSGGRVVKGVRFAGLRDAGDPVERAAAYEAQGADEVVLLDVSATPEGRGHQLETVRAVRWALGIPLTAGGGVRTPEDVARLLEAGADKVSVNTAAFRDPGLLAAMAERFGVQCTVLALDAARIVNGRRHAPPLRHPDAAPVVGGALASPGEQTPAGAWEVVVESGRTRTGCDAVAWAREAVRHGAGEILLTSFDRDGTRQGYDLALIEAVSRAVRVPVIASGGAETPEHLVEAVRAGADAVLAASIFHDGDLTVRALKEALAARGVVVRG